MHKVKCYYCGETFDRDKVLFVKVGQRRYAHVECAKTESSPEKKKTDKEIFFDMVKSIYGEKYNFVLINKQALSYIKQYHYTWGGMTACLHWFYNIKHSRPEDGNGGIGIIPYIYEEVRTYYDKIYATQKINKILETQKTIKNFEIQSPRGWSEPPHLLNIEE